MTDAWQGLRDLLSALLALLQANPLVALGVALAIVALLALLPLTRAARRARHSPKPPMDTAPAAPVVAAPASPVAATPAPATPTPTPPTPTARPERAGPTAHTPLTHRVFLSSTSVDLGDHRKTVHDTLERMNQFAVDMAQFGAGGADATTVSLTELASAEFVVLLVAWRYGFIPKGETHSITELEYWEALRLGRPVYVYLADPATAADTSPTALFPAATRDPEHAAQLAAFRQLLADSNRPTYDTFTTPDNLARKVAAALSRRLLGDAQAATRARPDATGRVLALADMPATGPLIGRDAVLADLLQRLRAGEDVGVFALEGMGGVGKTALAAAAVNALAEEPDATNATVNAPAFPGGVAWLACAGLEGASGLLTLLTNAARFIGRDDLAALTDLDALRQGLAAALRARPRTLLALDNLEPTLDAETALRTLTAPGHTTLLLTAREQVAPRLVYTIQLAPLPAPDAARLFAQRLRQDTAGARPTPADEPAIPALVAAVGGLPLAVELLAADAAIQGTALDALRVALDTAGVNAAAFRATPHRTLTTTFDRSLVALPERQRLLFAGLSLLPETGFPRAAALALARGATDLASPPPSPASPAAAPAAPSSPAAPAAPDPADDVAALVRAALVEPLAGGARLRLHPLLRAYARARLDALPPATHEALGDALLAFWLAYARAHPSKGGQDPAGMDAQEAEAPGLLAALAWAHAHARWRPLLDLVYTLNWTWGVRGRRAEERVFRPWAVEAARALDDREDLRFMTHELALLAAQTGDPQGARAGFAEALAIARQLGDQAAIQLELHELGRLDADSGNLPRARSRFEEALAIARELGDKSAIRSETHELALLSDLTGDLQAARAGYAEALAIARQLGDQAAIQVELHGLAVVAARTGDPQGARAGFEEALAIARQLGDVSAQARELLNLGILDRLAGGLPRAREELTQALALAQQVEDALQIAQTHNSIGFLARDEGDTPQACAHFREALARFERLSSPQAEQPRSMLRQLGCAP